MSLGFGRPCFLLTAEALSILPLQALWRAWQWSRGETQSTRDITVPCRPVSCELLLTLLIGNGGAIFLPSLLRILTAQNIQNRDRLQPTSRLRWDRVWIGANYITFIIIKDCPSAIGMTLCRAPIVVNPNTTLIIVIFLWGKQMINCEFR
jgi:hypothetical protein